MAQEQLPGAADVSPLQRRVVEIGLAGSFVSVLAEEFGEERALDILNRVVEREAHSAAAAFRHRFPEPTLASLYEVWKILGGDGRLDMELEELNENMLRFHVNGCRYAESYRALGLERLGVAFSCRRDEPFAKALIPGIRMKQSQTIMEGSPKCCFEYTWEEA